MSKEISKILRYTALDEQLEMKIISYVRVKQLLGLLKFKEWKANLTNILEIIQFDVKKRFRIIL